MKNLSALLFFVFVLPIITVKGQVYIDTISSVSHEQANIKFCFNNTKLMAGNSTSDRYIVYYNSDTIFLNVFQSGNWLKKVAHTGSNISSATLTLYKDSVWICWKQGAFIKTRFSPDAGNTWSDTLNVSPAGNVVSPSIFASDNGKIHFVWSTESSADTIVYHQVYNRGLFLYSPNSLSNLTGQGQAASVIALGDTVLSAWKEGPLPSRVWFRSSFNGGQTWNVLSSTPTTTLLSLSKDPNLAYAYDSVTNTHYVYLAFDGQNKIYLQRSNDFGNSWSIPDTISNFNKWSQFAHIDCNNKGFVGISYEQRPIGSSLFDDTKKDVGFTYSTDWGNTGSFITDTLAYTHNHFGSIYPSFNKIDNNNFYLAWVTNDVLNNKINVLERRVHFSSITGIHTEEQNRKSINIFPNLFSGQTLLQTDQSLENATLTVYNTFGQMINEMKNINGKKIALSCDNLTSGLYFIQLKEDNRIITVDKFVITD